MGDLYSSGGDLPPKFNAGLGKVMRIHKLWEMAHASKSNLGETESLIIWMTTLNSLKGEYFDRMKDENALDEVEKEVDIALKNDDFTKIIQALCKFELALHKIEKQIGYSVPDADEYGMS